MSTEPNVQIGRLVIGEFVRATPDPFTVEAMGNYLMAMIADKNEYAEHGAHYWHVYRDSFDYLLAEITNRSHGGTIIVIPEERVKGSSIYFHPTYSFVGDLQVWSLLSEVVRADASHDFILYLALRKIYAERLGLLAQLSCVDGALILSGSLDVVAFGSKLSAPKWSGDVLVGPNGFSGGGNRFDISKLGTRHNSAIDFIGASPGSLGFVISQDGPIRGLAKRDDNTILCWPDCRVSMSV